MNLGRVSERLPSLAIILLGYPGQLLMSLVSISLCLDRSILGSVLTCESACVNSGIGKAGQLSWKG